MAWSAGGWDFFVSYTQDDRAWAEWIAWQLEDDGHRVLIQAWDFVAGSNWIQSMQEGVTKAERTIAVLSPSYLDSMFGTAEWQAAWAADPTGQEQRLLVARVIDCDRPGLLGGVVGVDLFGGGEAEAKSRLRRMVAGALQGRLKPERPPNFPSNSRKLIPRGVRFPQALPRVWNVPARNPNFTGRKLDLELLDLGFSSEKTAVVYSVRGMGGVGKSMLATEYAHLHSGNYDVVWWLSAEQHSTIPEQMARLANHLGVELNPQGGIEEIREGVHEALLDTTGWLLVFDNAENLDIVRDWLVTKPLAPGIRGHSLVTTRRRGFDSLGPQVNLDVLTEGESLQLLQARCPDMREVHARGIADELEHLPLALEQAAAYLNKSQMPPERYLQVLRTRTIEVMQRGTVAGRGNTVANLWKISFERLEEQAPAAMQLLDVCAYFAAEAVPLALFTSHAEQLAEPLASAARDELLFGDVLEALVDYSLATRTREGLLLHRLVQAAIRSRHLAEPIGGWESTDERPNSFLNSALLLLRAEAPAEVDNAPENWSLWLPILPHVLATTEYVTQQPLGIASQVQPSRESGTTSTWLLDRAGLYLLNQGRYAKAAELFNKALEITPEYRIRQDSSYSLTLSRLADALRAQGNFSRALPLAERAILIAENLAESDPSDLAQILTTYALVLRDVEDLQAAERVATRALTITVEALGENHVNVSNCLHNVSSIMRMAGNPEGALPLAERDLDTTVGLLGPDHPNVAATLNNMSLIVLSLNRIHEAETLIQRALRIYESTLGHHHPNVATTLVSLSEIKLAQGDTGSALAATRRALDIYRTALGEAHPKVSAAKSMLEMILRQSDET